jgi:hypothetical protein
VDAKRWLRELRAELERRRLPPTYVERFVGELSEHLNDFSEDRMSTDANDLHGVFSRLGAPGQVAEAAAKEFRKARFARRHPVLAFVVMPIVALPLLWTAKVIAVILLVKSLGIEQGQTDVHSTVWRAADAALPYVIVALTALPVAIAAVFFCLLARRAGTDWRWTLAACSLLAVVGGVAIASLTLPTATTKGSFSFGFGVSRHPSPAQLLQFVLPLLICGWALWRQIRGAKAGRPLGA